MTQAEADQMYKWVKSLDLPAMCKLWRWITLELGRKIGEVYPPKPRRFR